MGFKLMPYSYCSWLFDKNNDSYSGNKLKEGKAVINDISSEKMVENYNKAAYRLGIRDKEKIF